jgi:hypothetical protein
VIRALMSIQQRRKNVRRTRSLLSSSSFKNPVSGTYMKGQRRSTIRSYPLKKKGHIPTSVTLPQKRNGGSVWNALRATSTISSKS